MSGSLAVAIAAAAASAAAAVAVVARARAKARAARHGEREREQELLDRLAAGLAHELKNPLGALSLNIQLLEEDLSASPQLAEASRARIATIKKDYRRFEEVINNFLRYASRRALSLSDVDLSAVVSDVLTFLKPEMLRRGICAETHLASEPAIVRCDQSLMKQALLNVILNAIEAMGAGCGTLAVSTDHTDDAVTLAVADTGGGVAPEHLPHVFDAYYSRKHGGTGLGLAITRRIIEDHGGTITIESTPGRGARVLITLPVDGPPAGTA